MPQTLKDLTDWLAEPTRYAIVTALCLAAVLLWRRKLTHPVLFAGVLAGMVAFFLCALPDPSFNAIVTKPDNVPIVILLVSVVFFTWLALRRAVVNDERVARDRASLEGELGNQKVLVWPDLVYIELICAVLILALLMVWSITIPAPLEEPASPARTPNPSKAPWYFLGLQELLVYFDPWIAGVLLPGFIIVGLCAIPFLDTNPKGSGYYTFAERPFAVGFFMVGFLLLWVSLLIMGTFLRGPNWSFFGPFEPWDVRKLEPMVSVDLSLLFYVDLLGIPRPQHPLLREAPGIVLVLGYFLLLPPLLGRTLFARIARQMGSVRYHVMMQLLLWAVLIPIKMVLRWTIHLQYFIALPEWYFNV